MPYKSLVKIVWDWIYKIRFYPFQKLFQLIRNKRFYLVYDSASNHGEEHLDKSLGFSYASSCPVEASGTLKRQVKLPLQGPGPPDDPEQSPTDQLSLVVQNLVSPTNNTVRWL